MHEGKIKFRQNTNMAKYKVMKYKRNKIQEYRNTNQTKYKVTKYKNDIKIIQNA